MQALRATVKRRQNAPTKEQFDQQIISSSTTLKI
jgi:hypothetical protein